MVAVTQLGDAVHWLPNRGGQLAVVGSDLAPATALDGDLVAVLEVVATHRGRAGDRRAELTTATDPGGTPLSLEDPLDTQSRVVDVVVPGLPFADGFETGDASAWSSVVP